MAEIVFERDVRRGPVKGGGGGDVGDVALGPGVAAVLVVDALGLAGVDVGVVPEGEGGVRGHGVVGVVLVADAGEAFVGVFAGAVVEGEDLVGWLVSWVGFSLVLGEGKGRAGGGEVEGGIGMRGGLTPLLDT